MPGRAGATGALHDFFAVGCCVCNKVELLALGYPGAIQWFAPVQPWLAAGGIALLTYALGRRLGTEGTCALRLRRSARNAPKARTMAT